MSPKLKTALIISGIAVTAVGVGFLAYRIYSRMGKEVIEGEHNTILVEKEIDYSKVEQVGFEEEEPFEQNWIPEGMTELQYAESISGMGDY